MKVDAKQLRKALAACALVAPETKPSERTVRLKMSSDKTLMVIASAPTIDLDVRVPTLGQVELGLEGVVPIAKLKKALPAKGEVALKVEKDALVVSTPDIEHSILREQKEDRPRWQVTHFTPSGECVEVPGLLAAILGCLPAACLDAMRYNLCGVHVGRNEVCATDGHRLHLVTIEGADLRDTILPREVCEAMDTLGGEEPSWGMEPNSEIFTVHGRDGALTWALMFKGIEGTFPDVHQVMPAQTILTASELSPFPAWPKDVDGARFTFNGAVRCNAAGFSSQFQWKPHAEVTIGIKGRYLRDAIAFAGEGAYLSVSRALPKDFHTKAERESIMAAQIPDDIGPIVIEKDNRRAVVMPMRI